jgi:hypothetical protein
VLKDHRQPPSKAMANLPQKLRTPPISSQLPVPRFPSARSHHPAASASRSLFLSGGCRRHKCSDVSEDQNCPTKQNPVQMRKANRQQFVSYGWFAHDCLRRHHYCHHEGVAPDEKSRPRLPSVVCIVLNSNEIYLRDKHEGAQEVQGGQKPPEPWCCHRQNVMLALIREDFVSPRCTQEVHKTRQTRKAEFVGQVSATLLAFRHGIGAADSIAAWTVSPSQAVE